MRRGSEGKRERGRNEEREGRREVGIKRGREGGRKRGRDEDGVR